MKDVLRTELQGEEEATESAAQATRPDRAGSSSASVGSPLMLARRLRETLDDMLEGCQIIGFDWRYLYVNDAAASHGRTTKDELLDRTMMEAYPGIEETEMFAALRRCMEERAPARLDNEFTYPDGQTGWFELNVEPAPEGILILSTDITDRKRTEESLRRTARALRTISGCHRAEMEATDEIELLQEVCRVIVEVAGYSLAWVALAGDEEESFVPVAYASSGEGDLEGAGLICAEALKGAAELAMSGRKPVICNNIHSDPQFSSWQEEAICQGCASCIALPLVADPEVLGVLNICAPGAEAFDGEEAEILGELADGVAHGLVGLRSRARSGALHGELAKLERQYA
ncbi:MAG TPA: GAF domain-containing protein, partial [Chloroflexi bacterium]|nr:GAF domain-containing protein [Chloroflexota bacterium]